MSKTEIKEAIHNINKSIEVLNRVLPEVKPKTLVLSAIDHLELSKGVLEGLLSLM